MNFCTVFDENYEAKGRALIASIQRWGSFDDEILVLDASTNQDLRMPPEIKVFHLWETASPELIIASGNRS